MKKTLLLMLALGAISLTGCQQLQQIKAETDKTVSGASQQVENAKSQAIQTKAAIDQKVQAAQDAADALNRLTK